MLEYNKVFNPNIQGSVSCKAIKDKYIEVLSNPQEDENKYFEMPKSDINSPFYFDTLFVKGNINKNKIKSLSVYFDRGS